MIDANYRAEKIIVSSSLKELHIRWADGHNSRYPFHGLRSACPCVFCQGGHENMGQPVDPRIFIKTSTRDVSIINIKQIGNYAIQIVWNDGHQTGIYRYEMLRKACPVENGIIQPIR